MKTGCLAAGFIAAACLCNAALAQAEFESTRLAVELGGILASESACGLTLDQDAIAKLITDKVAASDMGFANALQLMTQGQAVQLQSMSESSKTAHCTAISISARNFGLVK